MSWYRYDPELRRATLTLHIQPNARASAVAGRYGDALKVKVAAPAVDDKANFALIDFLHQWFKLPVRDIKIRQGARGRRKIVELNEAGPAIMALLASVDAACQTNSNNA
ncbi:MAG: DUF167 domain-containing protein [Betaproteobacteria bacterium]|nr:DUF167 domain-containing protein [Betaproteobacteria bacterium]